MKCIYCLQEKTAEYFRKAEHVIPQSFCGLQLLYLLAVKGFPLPR